MSAQLRLSAYIVDVDGDREDGLQAFPADVPVLVRGTGRDEGSGVLHFGEAAVWISDTEALATLLSPV